VSEKGTAHNNKPSRRKAPKKSPNEMVNFIGAFVYPVLTDHLISHYGRITVGGLVLVFSLVGQWLIHFATVLSALIIGSAQYESWIKKEKDSTGNEKANS